MENQYGSGLLRVQLHVDQALAAFRAFCGLVPPTGRAGPIPESVNVVALAETEFVQFRLPSMWMDTPLGLGVTPESFTTSLQTPRPWHFFRFIFCRCLRTDCRLTSLPVDSVRRLANSESVNVPAFFLMTSRSSSVHTTFIGGGPLLCKFFPVRGKRLINMHSWGIIIIVALTHNSIEDITMSQEKVQGTPIDNLIYPVESSESAKKTKAELESPDPAPERALGILGGKPPVVTDEGEADESEAE